MPTTHRHTYVSQPAKTYIHHLCANTGFHLEELQRVRTNRTDSKRDSRESMLLVCLDDDNDDGEDSFSR